MNRAVQILNYFYEGKKKEDITKYPLFMLSKISYKGAEPDPSFMFNAKDMSDAISKAKSWSNYQNLVYGEDVVVREATPDEIKNKSWIHNEYIK